MTRHEWTRRWGAFALAATFAVALTTTPVAIGDVVLGEPLDGGAPLRERNSAQQAVFKSEVDLVRVDALVVRDGAPVGGLKASDFELRDNGVAQTIVGASLEQIPIDAMLVLDLSGSINARNAQSLRDAALAFLDGLTPQDRVGILVFSGRSALVQRLTGDMSLIRKRLTDLEGGGSTALNDAIYAGLRLREPGVSRKAVIVFTDGIDNISWLSAAEVANAGKQSDCIVHAVVADLPGAQLRAADNPLLHNLARETGGQVWPAVWGPKLAEAFRAVLENLRSRYVLTYYPTGVPAEGWHDLDVRVKRGTGKVTARAGYYRGVTRRGPRPE